MNTKRFFQEYFSDVYTYRICLSISISIRLYVNVYYRRYRIVAISLNNIYVYTFFFFSLSSFSCRKTRTNTLFKVNLPLTALYNLFSVLTRENGLNHRRFYFSFDSTILLKLYYFFVFIMLA